ncbi:uncharacterized protein TA12785 [Theileria annulata]|uniref:Uncharacterized protein n=1 Tax=Theileria annulata TaxID=5874 RepID=Q4UE70_THEAN|nr:uncharacterized protein TA12785 [Theileria annulata]CAI74619.2 hypothetical protein TA12785 [Theileria annulata]|eukprot:XP_952351.1 hypothetical protein TA12785 [Theileria annulata]
MRFLHHSSAQSRFYTNRFYVKKCGSCKSLNSLSSVNCISCSNTLTDHDIRLRNIDHICEATNSRKWQNPHDFTVYRCFDFTVMFNRTPCSFIHLSAFPNGTFYDIKNFRKAHLPLISKMNEKCIGIFRDIIGGKINLPLPQNKFSEHFKAQISGKSHTEYVLKSAIFGFNYPNTNSHVDMHAILPPIESFNIFKSPFYYPLDKVISDLRIFGHVRQYSPAQIRKM